MPGLEQLMPLPKFESEREPNPYNFEKIAEIEPAMTELVSQLKKDIEAGTYDTLVSDEIGGRIPTLILRKILKERGPVEKINTHFVSGGHQAQENKGKYQEYFKKIKPQRRVLLVTEYARTGKSLAALAEELNNSGNRHFDIAVLDSSLDMFDQEYDAPDFEDLMDEDGRLIIGGKHLTHTIKEDHEDVSGVRIPSSRFSPHPRREVDSIEEEGRILTKDIYDRIWEPDPHDSKEERDAKFNDPARNAEYVRWRDAPLTDKEKEEIQRNINLARQDVNIMAGRIIEEIWPEEDKSKANE